MKLLIVAMLAGQQMAAPAVGDVATGPAAFATDLSACSPAAFNSPHPLVPGFEAAHLIEGERAGACRYTQTMPGDMHMECGFTEAGREAYAAEFEKMAAGQMSGSTQDKPTWADDCEIVMKDGKRLPAFGTTRTK